MQSADSDQEFPGKNFSNKAFSENEKFELLSAYLDGEVTATEYQLVLGWIASDRKIARHYQQQLKLRQALQSLGPAFLTSARTSKHLSSEHTAASEHTSEDTPPQNQSSRNAYTPYNSTNKQPPIHHNPRTNQLTIAMCDLTDANTSWRLGLLVLAVLGATAVTLSTGILTNKRRPVNLNGFEEPPIGQTPPKAMTAAGLQNQQIL